jgi:glycosyltransferase WbpL
VLLENNVIIYLGIFAIFVFSLSYYITSYVRNYSLRNNVIDIPNERSSHLIPTPTGGGLAISLSILLSTVLFCNGDADCIILPMALGIGVLAIGIVGWIDIHKEVSVLTRAIIYMLVSIWSIWQLGGVDTINIIGYIMEVPWLSNLIAILAVSWLINLYNFMDGTDGLAAVQAITTALVAAILFLLSGQYSASVVCLAIVFSTSGFLVWNWAPAKIFMGDVGSCSLGFAFGVLAIYGESRAGIPFSVWLILLSVFISDASFTLIKRMLTGQTWYRAHNTHAYQRLVQSGLSHGKLALYVLLINMCIVGPLAYFVWLNPNFSVLTVCSLYSVLAIVWVLINRSFSANESSNVSSNNTQ